MATLEELGLREVAYISDHKYNVSLYIEGGQIVAWVIRDVMRGSGRLVDCDGQPANLPPLSAEQTYYVSEWMNLHRTERDMFYLLAEAA
jgi:hypothetical protein